MSVNRLGEDDVCFFCVRVGSAHVSIILVENPISGMSLWLGKYMYACMYVYLVLLRPLRRAPSCHSCRRRVMWGSQSVSEPHVIMFPMQRLVVLAGDLGDCMMNTYDCGVAVLSRVK